MAKITARKKRRSARKPARKGPERRAARSSRPRPVESVGRRGAGAGLEAVGAEEPGSPGYAFSPPEGQEGVEETYGTFAYQEASKGAVVITDSWASDNVVLLRRVCDLPLNIQLHRLVAPLFEIALAEAMARCPDYQVRQLGGFVPRHKMHDPRRGLSIHSWGAAFDVNWDANGVGQSAPTDLPAEFVAAFTDRGWDWGGNWRMKDWMHFQYATGV